MLGLFSAREPSSAGGRAQAHRERGSSHCSQARWQPFAGPFLGRLAGDLCSRWKLGKSLPRERSGRILACSPQLIGITCPEILSHPASTWGLFRQFRWRGFSSPGTASWSCRRGEKYHCGSQEERGDGWQVPITGSPCLFKGCSSFLESKCFCSFPPPLPNRFPCKVLRRQNLLWGVG